MLLLVLRRGVPVDGMFPFSDEIYPLFLLVIEGRGDLESLCMWIGDFYYLFLTLPVIVIY